MAETLNELIERRDALAKRLEAIRADIGRGLDRDAEEQAVQLENFEVLQEIHRVTEQELQAVRAQIRARGGDSD
ncbi:MAG: hypothetical protein R3233_07195 [Xanthomonadales bacterium]|nr:hypothetical protein [Xanthomonadales bacterium]